MRRHQTAIREYLQLKPRHSRESRKIAVRWVFESAQVMDNPADLINVAVEQLRLQHCELPTFPTLDRMVTRVRYVVHRRIFAQVMTKLSSQALVRLDGLLKTTEVVQRHTSFQEIKESPKKPSLKHLDALLDHLAWLEALGEVDGLLSGIPPALVQHFATEAKALAGELREVQAPKKYTASGHPDVWADPHRAGIGIRLEPGVVKRVPNHEVGVVGKPLNDHIRWRRAVLQRGRHPH